VLLCWRSGDDHDFVRRCLQAVGGRLPTHMASELCQAEGAAAAGLGQQVCAVQYVPCCTACSTAGCSCVRLPFLSVRVPSTIHAIAITAATAYTLSMTSVFQHSRLDKVPTSLEPGWDGCLTASLASAAAGL
jgi:hypothetical protein